MLRTRVLSRLRAIRTLPLPSLGCPTTVVPLIAVVVLSVWATPAGGQPWPVKEFEVVNVEPARRGVLGPFDIGPSLLRVQRVIAAALGPTFDRDYAAVRTVPLEPETKEAIETHLRESAEILEAWGFPPPMLEPLVTTEDGREAYRVYLVTGLEDAGGLYHSLVTSRRMAGECLTWADEPIILLDADDILSSGEIGVFAFQTAGHELFHAVQYATEFYDGACGARPGAWITEGTAEAVGWDLVRSLRSPLLSETSQKELWGHRNYSRRLPVPLTEPGHSRFSMDPAYTSASFWRHLAEYDAAGSPPGPAPGPVDYRYLAQLLGSEPVERDCRSSGAECDAELRWLDDGLKSLLGVGLRKAYTTFVASYVEYGGLRAAPLDGSKSYEEWHRQWRWDSFDHDCAIVELEPGLEEQSKTEVFDIEDVAAQCWDVRPIGFGSDVAVEVEISAPSETLLSQFLGAVGGRTRVDTVDSRLVVVDPDGGGAHVSWTYLLPDFDLLPDGEKNYYLLANVAREAEETHRMRGIVVSFTALASAVTYSGAIEGSYPISGDDVPYFSPVHGVEPYPDACQVTLFLDPETPEDIDDQLAFGGWLPAPPRVGRYPVLDVVEHRERWAGTAPLPNPPVGTLSFQARLGRGDRGLLIYSSRGGMFEIVDVGTEVLHGRFDIPTTRHTGQLGSGGDPVFERARFEGYFVAKLSLSHMDDDFPCRPSATPADPVVGDDDGPVGP